MSAMSTKSTLAWQFTGSEAENAMRKMVFAAAIGIQDGTLSNLAQQMVHISLKLLMLLRAHRAAHAGLGAYVPPDDTAHDHWMANEQDLLDAVAELEADDDDPFIVLTETKFSFRCIPVWIGTLLTGLGSKKKHM